MTEAYSVTPLSPLRKIIAARMVEAKRAIPHFRVGMDVEMDALLQLRRDLRRGCEPEVSLNDLITKACAAALMAVPEVNIQFADNEIRRYRTADICIVTALEGGGLSTPIIRSAQSKSVREIASEVKSLTARAARNALRMDEIFGGSFSISNLGMYGVDEFDAIINPPQCAILAIARAQPRLIVSAEGVTRVATVLRATLSVDHRALDGAIAARFLAAFRDQVQQPDSLIAEPAAS
jgi:pyruvate dehydrogenase E2 component (dihydrolipoamide acetyltransferase)